MKTIINTTIIKGSIKTIITIITIIIIITATIDKTSIHEQPHRDSFRNHPHTIVLRATKRQHNRQHGALGTH